MKTTYTFIVEKPADVVQTVFLMQHKMTGKWSFVNMSSGHICPCVFETVDDAIKDIESYVTSGRILKYRIIKNSGSPD